MEKSDKMPPPKTNPISNGSSRPSIFHPKIPKFSKVSPYFSTVFQSFRKFSPVLCKRFQLVWTTLGFARLVKLGETGREVLDFVERRASEVWPTPTCVFYAIGTCAIGIDRAFCLLTSLETIGLVSNWAYPNCLIPTNQPRF